MANDIGNGVWIIDTLPFVYNGPVKLVNVTWTEQVAAGDQFVMKSKAGNIIIDDKAYAANFDHNFGFLGWKTSGIQITTLTSGKVMISVGAGKA